MEPCQYKKEIERLSHVVDGNGREGLLEEVKGIKVQLSIVAGQVTDILERLYELMETSAEIRSEKEVKEKISIKNQWQVGVWIGVILAILTIITNIVLNFIKL